jgi:outer membrane protein
MKNLFFLDLLIITILCIYVVPSKAQESTEISLDNAIEIAIAHNRDLKIAENRLEQSRKKINQVWGDLFPTIESSAAATRQGAESGFSSMSDGSYDIRVVQASLTLNPGVFYNSLKIASFENAYCKEDLRRIKHLVTTDTIKSYFSIIRAAELVKTRRDSRMQLAANYNDVANFYKQGSVPKLDLLQADLQYKNSLPPIMEAEQSKSASIDMLNLVLGAAGQQYRAIETMPEYPRTLNSESGKIIDTITQLALKNRPEIIQIDIRAKQAEYSESVQQSLYLWPTFFALANWGYNKNIVRSQSGPAYSNPTQQQVADIVGESMSKISGNDKWQKTWQIRTGATYRWNGLFPFDKTSQKEDEESLRGEEISLYLMQLRQSVSIEVRRNYLALKTAREIIDIRKDTISTAEESLRIAKESYKAGIVKNTDLLASESALSAARASYIDALYTFYVTLADLDLVVGEKTAGIIFEEVQK